MQQEKEERFAKLSEKPKLVMECAPIYRCLECQTVVSICWAKTTNCKCYTCSKSAPNALSAARRYWRTHKVLPEALPEELQPVVRPPGEKKLGRKKADFKEIRTRGRHYKRK